MTGEADVPAGHPGVDVVVNPGAFEGVAVPSVRRAVLVVLAHANVASAEISVTCLADDEIRAMNAEYLGKDSVTDVIAFSLGDDEHVVGDVYLGCDQAFRQAAEHGVDRQEELLRLAIHGTLHVLGHDHPAGRERLDSPMFALQEELLTRALESPDR